VRLTAVDGFEKDVDDAITAQLDAKSQIVLPRGIIDDQLVLLLLNSKQGLMKRVAFQAAAADGAR
jgi:hypothetical protein